MKNRYSQEMIGWLRQNYYQYSVIELTAGFNSHFNTAWSVESVRGCLKNHKITSGRTGRFTVGHQGWNKGVRGVLKKNKTSYKCGDVPHNTKPIGHERVDIKDGYILIKTAERNPYTGTEGYYRAKHVVLWEKKHGPVPAGHAVLFMDGDQRNFTAENLVCVNRRELVRLNQMRYRQQPDEVKSLVFALAKLRSAIGDKCRVVAV
jgi:hypothetical protein